VLSTSDLLERLVKEYQVTADHVVHGHCATFEEYRAKCERLRTLEQVEAIAKGRDRKTDEGTSDANSSS